MEHPALSLPLPPAAACATMLFWRFDTSLCITCCVTLRGVAHTALDTNNNHTNKHHHQQQVAYALTYNSVGTITAATADLVVANITCCGSASCSLAVAQTFSASWTDADATATAGVVARWGPSTYMRVCARVEPQLPCTDHLVASLATDQPLATRATSTARLCLQATLYATAPARMKRQQLHN